MRYLVISDIHANLEALHAVLQYRDYDHILLLGDIVGYGASPEETVQQVRRLNPLAAVRGNHDKVVAGLEGGDTFVSNARKAALWSQSQLSVDSLKYLRGLPAGPVQVDSQLSIVHGSPRDEDEYLLPWDREGPSLDALATPICFFGHTHIPTIFFRLGETTGSRQVQPAAKLSLTPESARYLINPGAVGQPRDGDPRAAFLVFDADTLVVEFLRVDYDIETSQQKIRDAGLPAFLWQRLARGD